MTEGIVIVGSAPPIVIGSPGALFATITATAPAFCAFLTFMVKPQVGPPGGDPRSTSAIAPAGKPTSGWQPRVGFALPSFTRTTGPATPAAVGAGPNAAPVAPYVPAALEGGSIVTRFSRPPPTVASPEGSNRR